MYELSIPVMRDAECMQNITRAVTAIDSDAHVACSLAQHTVNIVSAQAIAELVKAIEARGYPVTTAVELIPYAVHHCDQRDV